MTTNNNIDTTQFNETNVIKSLRSKQTRGRKRKYATEEERILARRAQQKTYRERKNKEFAELKALKASLEKNSL